MATATAADLSQDETAFLRTILAYPDDDAPRLVYADWVQEQGDEPRACFIRWQCDREPVEIPKMGWATDFRSAYVSGDVPGKPATLLNMLTALYPCSQLIRNRSLLDCPRARRLVVTTNDSRKTMIAWSRGMPVAIYSMPEMLRGRALAVAKLMPVRCVVSDDLAPYARGRPIRCEPDPMAAAQDRYGRNGVVPFPHLKVMSTGCFPSTIEFADFLTEQGVVK